MSWKFWKRKKEPTAVALRFFEMLEHQLQNNLLGINTEEHHLVMHPDVYNLHICNGPFTMPVEVKAHAYLKGVRMYMNYINKAVGAMKGKSLSFIEETDPIYVGVLNNRGEQILWGYETKDAFLLVPYSAPSPDNAPSPDLSPNGEE